MVIRRGTGALFLTNLFQIYLHALNKKKIYLHEHTPTSLFNLTLITKNKSYFCAIENETGEL